MKYLIIGLGNPGIEYQDTRHNIGYRVLDRFVDLLDCSFSPQKHAQIAKKRFKGKSLVLIKPETFMNLSGKAVNFWMQKEKISSENILVITDDIAIPFQSIRLKEKGSHGGHNGLKNIIDVLQDARFPRLKIGIGSDFKRGDQSRYVLENFSEDERVYLEKIESHAINIILSFIMIGAQRTMNVFNLKKTTGG